MLAEVTEIEFTSRISPNSSIGPRTPCVCEENPSSVCDLFLHVTFVHTGRKNKSTTVSAKSWERIRRGRPNKHARRVRRRVEWEFRFDGRQWRTVRERTNESGGYFACDLWGVLRTATSGGGGRGGTIRFRKTTRTEMNKHKTSDAEFPHA